MASKTPPFQYKDTNHILIALACIIALAFILGFLLGNGGKSSRMNKVVPSPVEEMENDETEETFCTADAMQCPDGSYVGRVGPNCQFAPCPGTN
jgi:hypothetical protein